eukprot:Clim_evm28s25 gene=Clim_evmTU28s25
MSNWDDSDEEVPVHIPKPRDAFADSDEEQEDVKDAWDADSDEEEKKEEPKPKAAVEPPKPKSKKKALKAKLAEADKKMPTDPVKEFADMTPEEQMQEKLRRQKLVEEADYENTVAMFGSSAAASNGGKPGEGIDDFVPQARKKDDFVELAKRMIKKVEPYQNSPHFALMMEDFVRGACTEMDIEDLKKVSKVLTVLQNERAAANKAKKGPQKKKKAVVQVERNDDEVYDDYDDYDFM